MNFGSSDWRQRRNFLHQHQGIHFHPMQYSILGYSTEAQIDKKYPIDDIASPLAEGILDKLNSIPDPLKKNLADTVTVMEEKNVKNKKMSLEVEEFYYNSDLNHEIGMETKETPSRSEFYPSLTGIAGFFSNFFGAISGAMFQRRPKSPASQYYDCFDDVSNEIRQGAPAWRSSKFDDQNKNKTPGEQFSSSNDSMNKCRTAAVQCESKLGVVKSLLSSKVAPSPPKVRQRRPRRVFVEPNSVEENFEDAFASDDYISVENDEYVEYFTIPRKSDCELSKIDAPKTKIEIPSENTEIVKDVTDITDKTAVDNLSGNTEIMPESTEVVRTLTEDSVVAKDVMEHDEILKPNVIVDSVDSKQEIISSCEDKIAKLKLLLQGKKKKPTRDELNSTISVPELVKDDTKLIKPSKTIPIEKPKDKHFKNPHRLSTDKRKMCRMKKTIQDNISFANEIDSDDLSSVENSPKNLSMDRLKSSEESLSETPDDSFKEKEYFDEVKGRFHSSSATDSEDSFQIVFTESPKLSRIRRPSDCDSEDSFIVFEDSPDSCFTSHDVFDEESNESGNESESELSDSGMDVCKLSHSLSRTVSDLTDNSLYEETENNGCDELDCAVRTVCEEISPQEIEEVNEEAEIEDHEEKRRGLLLDEARKRKKKLEPPKKVTFSTAPPTVRVMRVWAFAARQARAGNWERYSRDRERFKRRIADVDMAVSWVLKPQHRRRIMFQRFMPWWNQQKRKEAEERKRREQEEKERKEREEKERLEREEMERIQREIEEKEEIKRMEMELREERKRADRERMERRLQEMFEKEQENLLMEEELRQKRFMEEQQRLAEEQQQIKEEQQRLAEEQKKQQQILEKQGKQQQIKKEPERCQTTETKEQTQKITISKEQASQIKENQKTEKLQNQQPKNKTKHEPRRLNKEKIEKFQQNAEPKELVVKHAQSIKKVVDKKEEPNKVTEHKNSQIEKETLTKEENNVVGKEPNQTQKIELSDLQEKIDLATPVLAKIDEKILLKNIEKEKLNENKSNENKSKTQKEEKIHCLEQEHLESNKNVECSKIHVINEIEPEKETLNESSPKILTQKQKKTELNQEINKEVQQSTKQENLNVKVGSNQLDSAKGEVGKNDVGNEQKKQNVKHNLDSKIISSEGNSSDIKSENVQETNVKIENIGEIDTVKLQVDIDKAKLSSDSKEPVDTAPVGNNTIDKINLSVNYIDNIGYEHSDKKIIVNNLDQAQTHLMEALNANAPSKITINNNDSNEKPVNSSDSSLTINVGKTQIGIVSKDSTLPDNKIKIENIQDKSDSKVNDSKLTVNNISKIDNSKETHAQTKERPKDKEFENMAQIDKDINISNNPLDSKLITGTGTPKTNEKQLTNHIGTSSLLNEGIQNSLSNVSTHKIGNNINEIDNNVNNIKPKNRIKNNKTETQALKERRNRRINKKLMFLRDQLAEMQQELNVAKESVAGTSN